jgi:hypothetical protein
MTRLIVLVPALAASIAVAQDTPDIPSEKVIVVPLGTAPYDAGVPAYEPVVAEPPPAPQPQPDVPLEPPPQPPPERTLEALPPLPRPPEQLDQNPAQIQPTGPGAMIDGKPREGAFLSGPGSFTFLMHHTLMTGFGLLATQLIPRAIDAAPGICPPIEPRYEGVMTCPDVVGGEGARIAYLAGTLIGAGVGFTSAAIWQFNNWISHTSANFGIISSFFGGMFLGGFTDLLTNDAYAISWMTVFGNTAAAWLAAIVGGGDIALNKAALIVSGGAWAAIYAALIVGIVASTGGLNTPDGPRQGIAGIMLTPAIGAGAMALATLKFNPSFGQIMRANIFGSAVGGAVLLLSALLLGPATGFTHPVPYVLAGVGAIGAKTIVSLLWADAAENPAPQAFGGSRRDEKYRSLW